MTRSSGHRLRVDPIACDGFGYCAELLPELVRLDEWGYPIVSNDGVGRHLLDLARRAVRDCPRQAVMLERLEDTTGGGAEKQAR